MANFNPFKRGEDQEEAIRTGATNLTLGSGIVALLAVLAGGFVDFAKKVLGEGDTPDIGARKDLLVALIIGSAVLSSADVLARAYSKAATARRKQAEAEARRVMAAPPNIKASVPAKDAADEKNWTVVALRPTAADVTKLEFFIVKDGHGAEWLAQDQLKFQ